MNWIQEVAESHRRLKLRIHGTRIPLSPTGLRLMLSIYCTLPLLAGFGLYQLTLVQMQNNFTRKVRN